MIGLSTAAESARGKTAYWGSAPGVSASPPIGKYANTPGVTPKYLAPHPLPSADNTIHIVRPTGNETWDLTDI